MQEVPIKLYRTPDRLTVAAPMPGLLPEDITIEVTPNNHLVLHGALRGIPADVQVFRRLEQPNGRSRRKQPRVVEEQREMLVDEWTVGSYQREIQLPMPVDATLATATYGNGVLVVALPLAKRTLPARVNLERVGISRGERVGSVGHPVEPRSTAEHVHAAHHS